MVVGSVQGGKVAGSRCRVSAESGWQGARVVGWQGGRVAGWHGGRVVGGGGSNFTKLVHIHQRLLGLARSQLTTTQLRFHRKLF